MTSMVDCALKANYLSICEIDPQLCVIGNTITHSCIGYLFKSHSDELCVDAEISGVSIHINIRLHCTAVRVD